MAPSKFVRSTVLIAVALATVAVEAHRREPYNICDFDCVQSIYDKYCGGVECVYARKNEAQQEELCTTRCTDAITGKLMYSCLKSQDPLRQDFDKVQQKLASYVYRNACLVKAASASRAVEFCDSVADPIEDYSAEESTVAPAPAPLKYL